MLVLLRRTKQRHKDGYSVAEMGAVRFREMLAVEKALTWDHVVRQSASLPNR